MIDRMSDSGCVSLLATLVLAVAGLGAPVAGSGWPTLGYDLQNTSFNSQELRLHPPLRRAWG
jgi:hypothetical protein